MKKENFGLILILFARADTTKMAAANARKTEKEAFSKFLMPEIWPQKKDNYLKTESRHRWVNPIIHTSHSHIHVWFKHTHYSQGHSREKQLFIYDAGTINWTHLAEKDESSLCWIFCDCAPACMCATLSQSRLMRLMRLLSAAEHATDESRLRFLT